MKINKLILLVISCTIAPCVMAQGKLDGISIERGKLIYEQNCLACHQEDGSGVPHLSPPLIKASFVVGDKTRLINIVLHGLTGVEIDGESYANPMPSFDFLNDREIAELLTYVRNDFTNEASPVSPVEVTKVRKSK